MSAFREFLEGDTYIDSEYYLDVYMGTPFEDGDELLKMCLRASDKIDAITNYKLRTGYNLNSQFVMNQVRKATAVLVESYVISGGYNVAMQPEDAEGFTLGTFSLTDGSSGSGDQSNKDMSLIVPSEVLSILGVTGLLYAGIDAT